MPDRTVRPIRFLRPVRASKDANEKLVSIDATAGVQGWIVTNRLGEALLTSAPEAFDLQRLNDIGSCAMRMASESPGANPATTLEIEFSQGHVLANQIGNGWLIVLCNERADIALMRLTLNVTAMALTQDRTFQNDLLSSSQPKSQALSGSFSSAPRGLG